MPVPKVLRASAFQWVNTSSATLQPWMTAIDQIKQMAQPSVVIQAAKVGGRVIQTQVQDLIYGEATVNGATGEDYTDVAERVTVWADNTSVYVGIPDGDPALPRAEELDRVFPVLETAFNLVGKDAVKAFEQALNEAVF